LANTHRQATYFGKRLGYSPHLIANTNETGIGHRGKRAVGLAIKQQRANFPELQFVFAGKAELDVISPRQIEAFFNDKHH
jgi:hypothetical protein